MIATHNLDFAYAWADWIFVMDSGKLVLEGSPETVFQKREIMESLGLGIPLVLDLLKTELTVKESLKKWFSRG